MMESIRANLPFAKLSDRFLAYLIDTLPFGVAYYASWFLLAARWRVPPFAPETWRILFFAWLAAYVLYHWVGNRLGATVGKWAMGLQVADTRGEPLSLSASLLRALAMLLSTPLFNLGFLWALVQRDSRTWHDLLAGSVVVEAHPKTRLESVWIAVSAIVVFLGIVFGTWWFYRTRPTPMDVLAVEKARAGLLILARIEESYKSKHGIYTDRLIDLAGESGDAVQFREALREIYDPGHFRIRVDKDRYELSARALDRRGTWVTFIGPGVVFKNIDHSGESRSLNP